MELISIIVPIYNAESYLRRCVDSIINQTYQNLEVILVNDGSTDKSGQICDQYEKKYKQVKVIHKKNGGQSTARNIGIDNARGKYIAFVDSDDWIVKDIYEYCYNLAEEEDCDVVDFKIEFKNQYETATLNNDNTTSRVIQGKEILRDYLERGQMEKAPFSPCRKLYRRELFNEIRFPEGKINEDIVTNYRVLMKTKKIVTTKKIGYYYLQSKESTTRNGLRRRDFDLLDACEELITLTKNEEYKDISYLAQVKKARSYFSLIAKVAFYGIEDNELDEKRIIKELTKKLREDYNLLMKSPMPINRKLMITAVCVHINLLRIPLNTYKKIFN